MIEIKNEECDESILYSNLSIKRHNTYPVKIGNLYIGGTNPIVVQSMTDTETANIDQTVQQIIKLVDAGSEIVRVTVNNEEAAKAVPYIKEKLVKKGYNTPIAGCFHYNGHKLLKDYPAMAESLDKYRINPGNVGFGNKKDLHFEQMVEIAIKNNKAIRIGVNWGSLDQELTTKLMNDNKNSDKPKSAQEILRQALVTSAISCAKKAELVGLSKNKIIISCKVSKVQDLVIVYRALAKQSNYALHLGLTEAGMGYKGIISTTAALSTLLLEGIGDTIRCSLTPEPNAPREQEVQVSNQILQSIGIRSFTPQVTSCPGCGRTTSSFFRELASQIETYIKHQMPIWKTKYQGIENLNIAVMGCIVNGPGESKHADIGISLPGTGESAIAPVFIDGKKAYTLRGQNIAKEFQEILLNYISNRFSK